MTKVQQSVRWGFGLAMVVLASCGDDTTSASTSNGPGGGGSASSGANGGGGEGAGGPQGCLTNVDCKKDGDCDALDGARCNQALAAPRCQTLACGAADSKCSDPALCEEGLLCVDVKTFGTNEESVEGACTSAKDARALCLDGCLGITSDGGAPCSDTQKQTICSFACDSFPEDWKGACTEASPGSINAFAWQLLFCPAPGYCVLDVDCGTTEQFTMPSGCE